MLIIIESHFINRYCKNYKDQFQFRLFIYIILYNSKNKIKTEWSCNNLKFATNTKEMNYNEHRYCLLLLKDSFHSLNTIIVKRKNK